MDVLKVGQRALFGPPPHQPSPVGSASVQAEHGLHRTPQRRGNPCGCPRRGCPVIPGLGAHKGRPYGCVQDDNSDSLSREE